MRHRPSTQSEYRKWLDKVDQIVREPLPDEPSESMGTIGEIVDDMLLEDKTAKPPVGFPEWKLTNRVQGGLRESSFTILCGPTGSGKTTLIANMGVELAKIEVPIFVASVETGATDFLRKMLSIVGDFNAYGPDAKEKLRETAKAYPSIFSYDRHVFSRYDSRIHHRRLLADMLYAHKQTGAKVMFIDNLNFLLEVKRGNNQNQEMDEALHDMIVFCKRTPIHIVMVMHPRKTEGGRVESEFDIKGSSTAVQEASNVLLWNRVKEEDYDHIPTEWGDGSNASPKYVRELSFPKMRKNGRGVGSRVFFRITGQGEQLREVKLL